MNPYLLVNIKHRFAPIIPPNTHEAIKHLMDKVSLKVQVICALAAVKLVIPKWDKYVFENIKLTAEEKKYLDKAIKSIEKWLEGKATKDEVVKLGGEVRVAIALSGSYDIKGEYKNIVKAANTTARAVHNVISAIYSSSVHYSILAIVSVALENENKNDPLIFLTQWWERCHSLIEKELQDKYDIFCKEISREEV